MVNRIGRKTAPGFADPNAPVAMPQGHVAEPERRADAVAAAPAAVASPAEHAYVQSHPVRHSQGGERGRPTPLVEVEVSYERGSAPRTDGLRRVYEVWTNNHIYGLDSRMACIEVRKTGTTRMIDDHPFLGTRLVGGQAQENGNVEMSYPLPRPGSCAVFEARKGNRRSFSRTSPVTKVVLRLHILGVTDPTAVPTWEEVSGES